MLFCFALFCMCTCCSKLFFSSPFDLFVCLFVVVVVVVLFCFSFSFFFMFIYQLAYCVLHLLACVSGYTY